MSPVHSSSWWSTASTSNPSTVAGLLTSEATTERRRRPRRGCATSSPSWSPRGSRWSCTTGSLTSSSSTTTSGVPSQKSLAPLWLTLLKCFQQASMIPSTLQTLSPGLRCLVGLKKVMDCSCEILSPSISGKLLGVCVQKGAALKPGESCSWQTPCQSENFSACHPNFEVESLL